MDLKTNPMNSRIIPATLKFLESKESLDPIYRMKEEIMIGNNTMKSVGKFYLLINSLGPLISLSKEKVGIRRLL